MYTSLTLFMQISFNLENFEVRPSFIVSTQHLGLSEDIAALRKRFQTLLCILILVLNASFQHCRLCAPCAFNSSDQVSLKTPHPQISFIFQAKIRIYLTFVIFSKRNKDETLNDKRGLGLEGEQPVCRRVTFPLRDERRWCACSHRASKRSAELHTVRGWHFSKSHVRMQPFPFAHKSAITCWQAGRDWPRALRISSQG